MANRSPAPTPAEGVAAPFGRYTAPAMKVVLAATDFSDSAAAGVRWAGEIARARGARLHLVHGLMLPNLMADYIPSPPDLTEEIQAAAVARLDESANEVRDSGLDVSTALKLGIPSQSILEEAEETAADLVVIGTRGLSGIEHLLLGSTAERVVQRATCPVLSVHPGDADRALKIETVLVPTDFSRDARRATEAAKALLGGTGGARIVLLNVYHLPFEYTAYGTVPTSFDYFKDVEGAALEHLDETAKELAADGLTVETRAVEGYPPEAIVETAKEVEADLIAMGTHGRSGLAHLFLGSTAERVVQQASCPVLTVRHQKD